MSVQKKKDVEVISVKQLTRDVFSIWIKDEDTAKSAKPGQFLSLYCKEETRLLPRPISICEIDKELGNIHLVYRVVGKGTEEFSRLKASDTLKVLGPLGNGFTLEGKKSIIIGGGIGIPPMLELAKQLKGEKQIVLGYRDETFLNEEFAEYGKVYISTEDGSKGTKGNVIDAVIANNLDADIVFACGPIPMLKGIKDYVMKRGIKAQFSLEERMACGIGACLSCVCKTMEKDSHTNVHNSRICKEGPVFYAKDIDI